MTDTLRRGEHGRALMTFLDGELEAMGEAPTSWARRNNITPTNLGKWRDGEMDPTLILIEDIAAALGRPTIDLLIAAAYVQPEDVGGRALTPTPPPNVDDAIERDPSLIEVEREFLRAARRMGQTIRAGASPAPEVIENA